MMNTVELFSGEKSFSKIARKLGHNTYTIEINKDQNPDLCIDILELQRSNLPKKVDVLWASPPCTTFSVASIRHYWKEGKPKNAKTWHGISMILKTLDLIKELQKDNPDLIWFIENPRGMLRKQSFMEGLNRVTVSYCQYGFDYMKPTDIWTNLEGWKGKLCKPGASCHNSQPRGYEAKKNAGVLKLGTQGKKNAKHRSVIPEKLFLEIFKHIKTAQETKVLVKYAEELFEEEAFGGIEE